MESVAQCAIAKGNQDLTKGGVKFDSGKPQLSTFSPSFMQGLMDLTRKGLMTELLPFSFIAAALDILTLGAKKYLPRNWEAGMAWSRPFNALIRHMFAWWYFREGLDPETGKSHLHHALCNLVFLIEYEERGMSEFDDRPKQASDLVVTPRPDTSRRVEWECGCVTNGRSAWDPSSCTGATRGCGSGTKCAQSPLAHMAYAGSK
jgi:hypothetical protein